MKTLIQRILGPSRQDSDAGSTTEREAAAVPSRTTELETLEPRMLFSAAPVEAPSEAETDPEPNAAAESVTSTESGQEGQAAEQTGSGQAADVAAEADAAPAAADGESAIDSAQGVTLVDLNDSAATLNQETLDAIAEAAAERWRATGLTDAQSAALDNITYEIADLGGTRLGKVNGMTISIDDDAAGSDDWFLDATPLVDEEFIPTSPTQRVAPSITDAHGHYDLLSVVLHEQGHLLGLTDLAGDGGDVMNDLLSRGERRITTEGRAAGASPGLLADDEFMSAAPGDQTFFALLGGPEYDQIDEMVIDDSGNLILRGTVFGSGSVTDFAGGTHPLSNSSASRADVFVAKIDGATGNQTFFALLGGPENDYIAEMVIDDSGNLILLGTVFGSGSVTDFGGGTHSISNSSASKADGFVAKIDGATGNQTFFALLGGPENDYIAEMVIDDSGNLILRGRVSGTGSVTDFAGGTHPLSNSSASKADGFVAKIDGATGNQTFFALLGGPESDSIEEMVIDDSGNLILRGTVSGSGSVTDFAGGTHPLSNSSASKADVFVAKIDGATGNQTFFALLGGPESDYIAEMVIDDSGNLILRGTVFGSGSVTDFGGGTHSISNSSASKADVFVAKIDGATGNQTFFALLGGPENDYIDEMVIDDSGNLILRGTVSGSGSVTDFAGGTHPLSNSSASRADVFVAKIDGATGNQTFFALLGGPEKDRIDEMVIDDSGNLILRGRVFGTGSVTDFGGGTHPLSNSSASKADVFVAKIDGATGNQTFFALLGGPESDYIDEMVIDDSGNLILRGTVSGSGSVTDFAGGTHPLSNSSASKADGFVAKIDGATGNQTFFALLGGPENDQIDEMVIDDSGNLILRGTVFGSGSVTDFGGGTHSISNSSASKADGFVAKIDGATGNQTFFALLGGPEKDYIDEMVIDDSGNLILRGRVFGTGSVTDFGGGTHPLSNSSAFRADGFVAKIDGATGNQTFFTLLGGPENDQIDEMVIDDSGNLILRGRVFGTGSVTDFGGATHPLSNSSASRADGFVAKIDGATGNQTFFALLGGPENDQIDEMVIDDSGNLILRGTVGGSGSVTDFGGGIHLISNSSASRADVFVAKLSGGAPSAPAENTASVDSSGNATITADGDADAVTLSVDALGNLKISTPDGSIAAGDGTTADAVGNVFIPIAGLTSITLNTGDGDDIININDLTGFTGALDIDGGDGQDAITFNADVVLDADNDADLSAEEVYLNHAGIETTGAGSITIDGTGSGAGTFQGINLAGTDLTASGTGTISLTGQGGNSGSFNEGVQLNNNSTVSTAEGDINIAGTGTGDGFFNSGVALYSGSSISAGGNGELNLTGSATSGAMMFNEGVIFYAGTSASVEDGDMNIVGTAGGTMGLSNGVNLAGTLTGTGDGDISVTGSNIGESNGNTGIRFASAKIDTTAGSGSVTLKGTGSTSGVTSNTGVLLVGGSIATGDNGGIDIDGTGGGTTAGSTNAGVSLGTAITLTAAGTGAITIDGTGGSGTSSNDGVIVEGASIVSSSNGDVTVKGTGRGTDSTNRGVHLAGTVRSTGTGSVAIHGTGSTTAAGTSNNGVSLAGATVSATNGAITMTGAGGTGSNSNDGVLISSSSQVTTTGLLSITGTANTATTGIYNHGVYIFLNNTINGGAGSSIIGTGGGGSLFNHGVEMNLGNTSNLDKSNITGTTGAGALSADESGDFFTT